MMLLSNATGASGYIQIQPGLWRITTDAGAGATVTFQEKDGNADGTMSQARDVLTPAGVAYSFTTPGGTFLYTASGWGYLQATAAGGNATVKADPVAGGI